MASETVNYVVASDTHIKKDDPAEKYAQILNGVKDHADFFLLAGDIPYNGNIDEMQRVVEILVEPAVALLGVENVVWAANGNHDHEGKNLAKLRAMVRDSTGRLIDDGAAHFLDNTQVIGTEGVYGMFNVRKDNPFPSTAEFMADKALIEYLKLEHALQTSRVSPQNRLVVLHVAPTDKTIQGESESIYGLLGSRVNGDIIRWFGANSVVHGHAHKGFPPEGLLEGDGLQPIPVYNAAFPLRSSLDPDHPYVALSIPKAQEQDQTRLRNRPPVVDVMRIVPTDADRETEGYVVAFGREPSTHAFERGSRDTAQEILSRDQYFNRVIVQPRIEQSSSYLNVSTIRDALADSFDLYNLNAEYDGMEQIQYQIPDNLREELLANKSATISVDGEFRLNVKIQGFDQVPDAVDHVLSAHYNSSNPPVLCIDLIPELIPVDLPDDLDHPQTEFEKIWTRERRENRDNGKDTPNPHIPLGLLKDPATSIRMNAITNGIVNYLDRYM